MKKYTRSIRPPVKTKGWKPKLPTIREEPFCFFFMADKQQQRRPRNSMFYEEVVNDLKISGNVEPELLAVISSVYAKKIAQDYVRSTSSKQKAHSYSSLLIPNKVTFTPLDRNVNDSP
jgi:hypothetical protein